MRAGNSRGICIRTLMAGGALQRRNAFARRPTHHVEEMSMTIITLLRVTPGCVAVDTARVGHYGINLAPGGKACGAELARFAG